MRLTDTQSKLPEKQETESVIQKKQAQELTYLGSQRPLSGHTLYEINTKTMRVRKAAYKENRLITWWDAVAWVNGQRLTREVIQKKDCIYISALNAENALTRYMNQKGSAQRTERVPLL